MSKAFTDLPSYTNPSQSDVLAIVDTTNNVSKEITVGSLMKPTVMNNPHKFGVYRSAALTTAGSAWTEVPFDTKNFDTSTNIDVSTNKGRFTAPVAGFYFFSAAVSLASASGAFAAVSLYVNGAITNGLVGAQIYSPITGTTLVPTISGLVQLSAGDYVEVYVNQNAANPATVNTGKFNTWFQGFLVSAL